MKPRAPAPIVIAAIVVLAVSAAWAIVAPPLLGRMESAAATIMEREAASALGGLGLSASYREASPRLLGSIELRGVELRGGESVVARARRLELRYGLGALLGGRFELASVRIDGVTMAAELADALALVERLASAVPGSGASADPGATALAVELRRLELSLDLGDGATADLALRAADLLIDGPGAFRASAAGSLRASDPSGKYLATTVELPFSCTASVRSAGGLGGGSGLEASLAAVVAGDSDLGRLSRTRIDAKLDDSGLSASVEPGAGIERLLFEWDPASGLATLDAAVSRWSPASLFYPTGRLSGIRPWLESSYSGSLSVSSDLSAEGTVIVADLGGVIPLELPGGRPRAALVASGGWETLRVRSASLRNGAIDAEFSGELSLGRLGAEGRLSASYSLKPGLDASAEFELSGAGHSWFAYAPAIRAADATIGDATISLELSSPQRAPTQATTQASFYLDASLPAVQSADGDYEAEPGEGQAPVEASSARASSRLTIEGAASLGDEPYLEAVARVGTLSLEAFPGLLAALAGDGAASALAPLSVEGELSLFSDLSGLSYNSSGLLVVYDGAINGFGMLGFSGGLDGLRLSSIDATVGGYSVKGSASLEYGAPGGPAFAADIRVEDVPYAISGAMANGAVVVSGDYGLRFVGSGSDDEFVASLDIDQMPVPLFGTVSFLSADADGRFSSPGDWDLVFDSLALEQPYGSGSRLPSVSLAGAFDESGGRVGSLGYRDAVSSLEGSANVTWTLSGGFRVSGNARLAGPAGEYYALDGEYSSDGAVDAAVSTRKAPLARLALPWLRGVLDADARIGGSIGDPTARFDFIVNGGQRADNLPFAAGAGTYERGVFSLVDSRARLGDQSVSGLTFSYGVEDAAASLSADVELAMGRNRLTARLIALGSAVGGALGGAPDAPSTPSAERLSPFSDYMVSGELSGAAWTDGDIGDVPFSIRLDEGASSLSMGASGELEATFGAAGELRLSLDRSLPISLEAAGVVADGAINVDARDAVVDLPFLFTLIGLPMLSADSGVGSGSVRIRGKAIDPSVEGSFELADFYLSVPDYVPEPIGPLDAPLFFTGKTMETLQTDVPCGDAVLTVALEGILNRGIPDDVHLTVSSTGEGLVPVSTKLLGLDIDGLARPELVIDANSDRSRMTGSILLASGDVVITPGIVSGGRPAGQGAEQVEPAEFTGALDISFGKAVRVYFPDERLPVIYGLTDPSSRLAVDFDAALGEFNLKGQAVMRGGSVFYIQRNFYLKHATIDFDEDAEQFDPLINVEAETRTSSESGPVIVTLRAADSRLSSLSFTLESSPSMAEDKIQQMLGQNLIGAEDGAVDLGRFVFENSDLIPQLNVMSVLERNLHGILGLDLFVVRSQVFQRWLYDVSGLSGSSGALNLADYLDETAIVGGKYIGDKLFAQLALSLVADPLASSTALSLDSELSLEWEAPHFTLNWSIEPEHPDSLFIEDQSFSFLWRIPLQ